MKLFVRDSKYVKLLLVAGGSSCLVSADSAYRLLVHLPLIVLGFRCLISADRFWRLAHLLFIAPFTRFMTSDGRCKGLTHLPLLAAGPWWLEEVEGGTGAGTGTPWLAEGSKAGVQALVQRTVEGGREEHHATLRLVLLQNLLVTPARVIQNFYLLLQPVFVLLQLCIALWVTYRERVSGDNRNTWR